MLGLGIVIATGWATLSGAAAQQYSGCGRGSTRGLRQRLAVGALAFAAAAAAAACRCHCRCPAAHQPANRCPARRPAIVLSYLFSGLAALLSACCFAELCAE